MATGDRDRCWRVRLSDCDFLTKQRCTDEFGAADIGIHTTGVAGIGPEAEVRWVELDVAAQDADGACNRVREILGACGAHGTIEDRDVRPKPPTPSANIRRSPKMSPRDPPGASASGA